jgi:prepilin peptidase CpaA
MTSELIVNIARLVCVLGFTIAAAVIDWRFKRIPNAVTVWALAGGALFHLAAGAALGGVGGALYVSPGGSVREALGLVPAALGFAVGFGMLFILWLVGSGGGGDVKYMGALGAWLGPVNTFYVFLIGAVITVVGSILVLVGEALRIGISRTKARYLSAKAAKTKGSAEAIEEVRQQTLVKRRLMPWAVPAGIAAWIVLVWAILRG